MTAKAIKNHSVLLPCHCDQLHKLPTRREINFSLCCADKPPYPAFLSKHWFQDKNASNLRQHVRDLILQLFLEQKRLPEDHPTVLAAVEDRAHYAQLTDDK